MKTQNRRWIIIGREREWASEATDSAFSERKVDRLGIPSEATGSDELLRNLFKGFKLGTSFTLS